MTSVFVILTAGALLLAQEWKSGPVLLVLEPDAGEVTVAGVYGIKLTATVPAMSLEESLRTGRDRHYAMESSLHAQLSRIDGLQFLGDEVVEETVTDGQVRTVRFLRFAPRRTGTLEIPALDLVFASPVGPAITLRTAPVAVAVRSLVYGDPLAAEPRPALALPRETGSGVWTWAVAIGLAAGAGFWKWRERAESALPLTMAARSEPRQTAALEALATSPEPARWLEILRDLTGGMDPEARALSESRARELMRELDLLRFGPEGTVRPKALRKRIETFIRDAAP